MEIKVSKLKRELQETCDWIESYGIRVQATRFARYRQYLERMDTHISNGEPEKINQEIANYIDTLYEASEIGYIYHSFKDSRPDGIEELLKIIVKGEFSPAKETSENSGPRNRAYEASLGARLSMAQINVSFKTTGDVSAELDGTRIYFQCKRLSSIKKIRENLKDGLGQLKNDYKKHKEKYNRKSYGYIAVDITRLVNPQLKVIPVATQTENRKMYTDIMASFIQEHIDPFLHEKIINAGSKNTIGLLCRISSYNYIEPDQKYSHLQDYMLRDTAKIGSVGRILSDGMLGKIMNFTCPSLDYSVRRGKVALFSG